jgi:hypothetical protein
VRCLAATWRLYGKRQLFEKQQEQQPLGRNDKKAPRIVFAGLI